MFIAVLDIVVKTCKPPNYPSNYEWMNKMCYIPLPYYLAMKRNEVMIYYHTDEPWKHAKWKKPITKDNLLIHLYAVCRTGRSVETECRDPWLPTAGRIGRHDGHGVSFWDNESVLKLDFGDDLWITTLVSLNQWEAMSSF